MADEGSFSMLTNHSGTAAATTHLEVLFTPADFAALAGRDLSRSVCVVFDVLRATTSMLTALSEGARGVVPAAAIPAALEVHGRHPGALLAGERDGVRITRELTGRIDFDLGNSPREFRREVVAGRMIIMTTTNGTRALRACAGAATVLVGGFVNLPALARWIGERRPAELLLVCSGTYEEASYEDTLGAGALCSRVWEWYAGGRVADSAALARRVFEVEAADLPGAMTRARNGRRLLAMPELRDDVRLCVEVGTRDLVARLDADGVVRRAD